MGLTCKPMGKFRSHLRKMENEKNKRDLERKAQKQAEKK